MLISRLPFLFTLCMTSVLAAPAIAMGPKAAADITLVPHKALYDIDMIEVRSGGQILNISGKMFYEWKPTCEAWVTDHRFSLHYEYADSPGMQIVSDFSTFESFDGKTFDFTSRRKRDGQLYQELRGRGEVSKGGGEAVFSIPEDLVFDLKDGTYFPMGHTVELVKKAREGKKFFSASVFDGSDEEGPVEINTFIGAKANPLTILKPSDDMDMSLLNTEAWNVRMAVFPQTNPEAAADYEMSMVFHDNGIISDMVIEYDDFSISQKLVALEKIDVLACEGAESAPVKNK